MNLSLLFPKIKMFQPDEAVTEALYRLSGKSLFLLLLLVILATVALYPVLKMNIVVWGSSLALVSVYRLYLAYQFKQNRQKYSVDEWYNIFVLGAMLTALIFSTLGFVFIHKVGYYHQFYILAVLLGLSSGSTVSLSPDIRVNIVYATILLVPLTLTMMLLDGTPLHLILAISLLLYYLAQVTTIYKIYEQKNEFNTLQSEHMLLNSLFKNAPLGIFTYNNDLEMMECNAKLSALFEHEEDALKGLNLAHLPDDRFIGPLKDSLSKGPQSYEGPYVSIKGKHFWVDAKAFSFSDNANKVLGGVGMIEDKTKEHNALVELEYMAKHDVLTGLLNRRGLKEHIQELVAHTRHRTHFSILFYLDLNQFKSINDSLGHAIGDEVLLTVSKRLVKFLDEECLISRLGGDEFIIIAPYVAEDEETANSKAEELSQEILNVFVNPFIIKEMHLHIKSSIGIVPIEPGYTNTDEIIRHADLSMYQAKMAPDHISYYDPSLDKKQKELFLLQHDLAYAVKKDQFGLFFQPVVTIKDNTLRSAEALIRWQHATKGLLTPEDFIPLAIKAGLLPQITWWVVESVCKQISQWKEAGQWKLEYISINVNAQQLVENNFPKVFFEILHRYGLETTDIMIEITERSLIDNFKQMQDAINVLRSKGVKCAIDDFGIGYSSLSYLKRLSFHTLKIDKEFVKDVETKPQERHLMATILNIGRQFNYNIVIEGIENENQKNFLLGLDENLRYQGFYFSEPLDPEKFRETFLS
ncbi:sensor domain-containing protein [Sulfurovum sp.]|uniref:sensor domain-containing protein n=1 Tax=Sulfurovum sp. TaxID=1969726 RepID=UPI002F95E898